MRDTGSVDQFNRMARRYDSSPGQYGCRRADPEVLAAAADLSPDTVLDVGCGTGRLLSLAAGRWPRARLYGVDPAGEMVRVAGEKLPRARLHVCGAERLPFPDRSFDLVLSTTAFGHWQDQPAGLREIARVLRRPGRLVLAEHRPPPRWARPLLRLVGGELPAHRTPDETRHLLTQAGFQVRSIGRVRGGLVLAVAEPAS
ncbi:methyltransferase domain-containing protein [Nonomuraea sp. NPDC003804]|uniref:class I SAM-dependent methyltransferase n=1 Tax=Nonomuraea sp. NPDC003804 TaxID=3154547 RepID=UPI0033A067AD